MESTKKEGATGVQAFHQTELDAGRFLIQRCTDCSRHVYFPRESCPHCGGAALEWKQPSGLGTVHAVTTVRRKPAISRVKDGAFERMAPACGRP